MATKTLPHTAEFSPVLSLVAQSPAVPVALPPTNPYNSYRSLIDEAEVARAQLEAAEERYNRAVDKIRLYEMSESGLVDSSQILSDFFFNTGYMAVSPPMENRKRA